MSPSVVERLAELGIELPDAPSAVGAYVPTVRAGALLFTSGQIATTGQGLLATGVVGVDVELETARACARQCLLNVLAQVHAAIGALDRIQRVIKLTVFVASAPGFTNQSAIADSASDLLASILGERGAHARSSLGVAALPLGSPVEIEAIFEVEAA